MKHIYKFGIASLMAIFVVVGSAQHISPSAGRLLPTDISFSSAVARARHWIGKITGTFPSMKGVQGSLRKDFKGRRIWDVMANDLHSVSVSSSSGELVRYVDQGRMQDQWKGRGRTGKVMYRTESAWRAHLTAIASKMDVPASTHILRLSWAKEGTVKDANSAGYVAASFADRSGQKIAIVNCDPQDGKLVIFCWVQRGG